MRKWFHLVPIFLYSSFSSSLVLTLLQPLMAAFELSFFLLWLRLVLAGMIFFKILHHTRRMIPLLFTTVILAGGCFPYSLISFLLGIPLMALLGRCLLFLEDAEAPEIIKLSVGSLLIGCLLLLVSGSGGTALQQAGLSLALQTVLMLILVNLRRSSHWMDATAVSYAQRFYVGLGFFNLIVVIFQQPLYTLIVQGIKIVLSFLSQGLTLLFQLFDFLWLLLAQLVYWLLSALPFSFTETSSDSSISPTFEPWNEPLETQNTAAPVFFKSVILILGVVLLGFVVFLLIRNLSRSIRRSMIVHQNSKNELHDWIDPSTISHSHIIQRKRNKLPRSKIRRQYKKTAEKLISLNYPYPITMTPAEFLASLPQKLVDETDFSTLTQQYQKARYQREEK